MKILHTLLPLLFILCISACKQPQKPEFKSMENVKFQSVMLDKSVSVNMIAQAVLHNPNPVGVTITGMDFDLFADGKKVSKVTQNVAAEMPANSDFKLPLAFSIPLAEVFKDFKPTIKQLMGKRTVNLKVVGHLKVKAGVEIKIPVSYEDKYDVALKDFINF